MDIVTSPWFWIMYGYAGMACWLCWFDPRYYKDHSLWIVLRHAVICVLVWPVMPLFFLGVHFGLYVWPFLVRCFWTTLATIFAVFNWCGAGICYVAGRVRQTPRWGKRKKVTEGCLKSEKTNPSGKDHNNE